MCTIKVITYVFFTFNWVWCTADHNQINTINKAICGKASMLLYIDWRVLWRVDEHSCCHFTKQEAGLRLKILAGQQKVRHRRKGKNLKNISLQWTKILCKFCLKEWTNKLHKCVIIWGLCECRFLVCPGELSNSPCQPDHYNP